jgi:hypothetical protein
MLGEVSAKLVPLSMGREGMGLSFIMRLLKLQQKLWKSLYKMMGAVYVR